MIRDISEHKYLFHNGKDLRSYEFLGSHPVHGDASEDSGVLFRVWAPRARQVSVAGNFNDWNTTNHPMSALEDDPQIWELFIPEASEGDLYKYAVESDKGKVVLKADPYAFFSENGDSTTGSYRASIVYDLYGHYDWEDGDWMRARRSFEPYRSPMSIYEVHLGSWRRKEDGSLLTYRQMAEQLIPYVKEMGYTHVELLPVMEYPFEGSWGYQVTGYYSPTSRYGRPEDLKYLIDLAHRNGIGVIMDWVPAHFPKDEHGLVEFDGYPLYEDSDPLRMEHKGWGTLAFDFGRPEVLSFLISNAHYFCDVYHVDGLRVDAVAAMLYLNYDRKDGEWRPNDEGGVANKEAINFLRKMNENILSRFPGVITVAEESTAWPGITRPPYDGGLGFNYKWNMGWMNDELDYFSTDPLFRRGNHHKLVFSLDYAFSENYILPISHDEVVHGKRSLLDKMPGEYDDKFAGLRAFLTYMYTHPGKKLTFMGTEIGQFTEWNEGRQLDWMLLDYDRHRQIQDFMRALNHFYLDTPSLWRTDHDYRGFRWIDGGNIDDNVITFIRYSTASHRDPVVVALNLSGNLIEGYKVGVPKADAYVTALDTDDPAYGGNGIRTAKTYKTKTPGWNGFRHHIVLDLPALSAVVLEKKEV